MATPSNALVEKRQAIAAKQKELGEIFTAAKDGDRYDYSRAALLEKLGAANGDEAHEKIKARNVELDDLSRELQQMEAMEIETSLKTRDAAMRQPVRGALPALISNEPKSFGELVVESKTYLEARAEKRWPVSFTVDIGLKTLMTTAAGWAPRDPRIPRVVDKETRPVQVLDLIPIDPTDSANIHYMLETTRTQAAIEVAEGAPYAEDAFALTQQDEVVRKIGSILPVTDEQLDDVAQVRAYLDNRMRFGLRQRLDTQVLVGDGTAPNLSGITDRSGIQTQAKSADPVFDAIFAWV